MDTATTTTASCPYCGASFDFPLWPTLDAELDHRAADSLVHGRLFEAVCPECGSSFSYVYPIFFHDPVAQVGVWYDPTALLSPAGQGDVAPGQVTSDGEGDSSDVRQMLESWVQDPSDPTGASTLFYVLRHVSSHYELAEKALASRLGIDDRVLELAKVQALTLKYGDDVRMIRRARLFLDDLEDDGTIRLLGLLSVPASEPGSLWGPDAPSFISEERLHLVKVAPEVVQELRQRLDPVDQNPADCVVDRAWAMRELGL